MEWFSFLQYSFIQRAFLAGSFIAVLCAVLGLFLVLRRMSFIGDGLSHVSFGAVAVGLLFGVYPIYAAVPIVILASFFIYKLSEKSKMYGDAAIGIVSAVGISTGVIISSVANGFNVDLFSYLFGSILSVSISDVWVSFILSSLVFFVLLFFYQDLFSVTFEEDYALVTGVKVKMINILILVVSAITVVLAVKVVGVMLVSALLILPAVSALQVAKGFKMAIVLSITFALISVFLGIIVSFFANLPTGAVIVFVSFLLFLLTLIWRRI